MKILVAWARFGLGALEVGQRVLVARQRPDGLLYLLTDEDDGRLLRVRP